MLLEKFGYDVRVVEIPFREIKIREGWNVRKEGVNEIGAVNTLKCSIEEVGLIHPLQVNKNHELVSGFRRHKVISMLGWATVPCNVVDYENEYHERLVNIDENLERRNLDTKSAELCLAMKKEIYGILYPHTVRPGKAPIGQDATKKGFAEDTAEKTGMTKSNIDRMVKRVEAVAPEVRKAYENDKINSSQVDELVKLDKEDQAKVLKKIEGTSVAETRLIVEDVKESRKEKQNAKLMDKDDKLLAAVFDVEKVIAAIKRTDLAIEQFYQQGKHKILDKDYTGRLKQNVAILLETIDRRMNIDTFLGKESGEGEE